MRTARRAALLALLAVTTIAAAGRAAAPPLSLETATVSAAWKESWLTGSVKFAGTVGGPASLTVAIKRADNPAAPPTARTEIQSTGGAFSGQLKLPARPRPGVYALRVFGTAGGEKLTAAEKQVTLPAPPEGIIDKAWTTTTKGGPPMKHIKGPRTIMWAHFHFFVPPKSGRIKAYWYSPSFKYLGVVNRKYHQNFDTFVRVPSGLEPGNWWVFIRSGNRIAIRVALRLT